MSVHYKHNSQARVSILNHINKVCAPYFYYLNQSECYPRTHAKVEYSENYYIMWLMTNASTRCIIPWLLDEDACGNNYCIYHFVLVQVAIFFLGTVHTRAVRLRGSVNSVTKNYFNFNTLRTGDANLRFYITTVQDGWRKSAFLTRDCFPWTIHLIMQYIEPVSEWFCWRMFIETWLDSELIFGHRAFSI